jgi:hypothetical protein
MVSAWECDRENRSMREGKKREKKKAN